MSNDNLDDGLDNEGANDIREPVPLTIRQQEFRDLYEGCMSITDAAKAMGITRQAGQQHYRAVVAKGHAHWMTPAPISDQQEMIKTTVQYDKHGRPVREWRRLVPGASTLNDVVEGLCEKVRGMAKVPTRRSRKTDSDELLFELDIYDAHVGLYADERETLDADYDCHIAANRMYKTAEALCRRANRPQKVVVVFGGDMLHSDNRSNKTEHSGNVLDVDTRYHRVVQYIIKACREVVQLAASIGAEVEVVVLEGNHSWHSEVWLAQVLSAYYDNCPNVHVRVEPNPRKRMIWGQNLLVWSHGDKIAATKWAAIIAAEMAVQWGQTKFRHLKCGHIHHQKVLAPVSIEEQAGIVVEYLPALCATDAYHTGAGYVGNMKGAVAFEYSKTRGPISRFFEPA